MKRLHKRRTYTDGPAAAHRACRVYGHKGEEVGRQGDGGVCHTRQGCRDFCRRGSGAQAQTHTHSQDGDRQGLHRERQRGQQP